MQTYPPQAKKDICAHKACRRQVKPGHRYCCDACAKDSRTREDGVCPCGCHSDDS